MNEQEQIKGITRLLEETHGICGNFSGCTNRKCSQCYAEAIYNAGYRKADEVRKGTAEEIVERLRKYDSHFDDYKFDRLLDDIELDYRFYRRIIKGV